MVMANYFLTITLDILENSKMELFMVKVCSIHKIKSVLKDITLMERKMVWEKKFVKMEKLLIKLGIWESF